MITIQLSEDNVRETLIALRDRYNTLINEVAAGNSGEPGAVSVANIARRQATRVLECGIALATAVGETF